MNLWLIYAQVTTASKEPELTELPEACGTAKGLVAARPVGPRWRSTGPTRGVETILWHPLNKTVHNLYICSGFFHQLSFLVIAKGPKKPFAMSTPLVFRKAPQLVAAPEGEFQGETSQRVIGTSIVFPFYANLKIGWNPPFNSTAYNSYAPKLDQVWSAAMIWLRI